MNGTQKMGRFSRLVLAAAVGGVMLGLAGTAQAAGAEGPELKHVDWSFDGPFGTFDRSSLRRGFQVYKQVCSSCHSLNYVAYRNLADEGGPEFSEAEVKAIAADYSVTDGPDENGDMYERPALPKDKFVKPFANEQIARMANGGALPPDLSLIIKAREDGANYVYSLLTGYEEAPAGVELAAGMHYNPYFSSGNGQIAMAAPISEDIVEFSDGTPATVDQIAHDVVMFLTWAAEPKLEARHRIGFMAMIYLVVLSGLLYFATRKVWAGQAH